MLSATVLDADATADPCEVAEGWLFQPVVESNAAELAGESTSAFTHSATFSLAIGPEASTLPVSLELAPPPGPETTQELVATGEWAATAESTGELVIGDLEPERPLSELSPPRCPFPERFEPQVFVDSEVLAEPEVFVDPEPFDLPGDPPQEPEIHVDPVGEEAFPDPIDVRVQFVSSDPGWAAYYYCVRADGSVSSVMAVASYDDPTISAFVAEHQADPRFAISDTGSCWVIGDFPLEWAPPLPEPVVVVCEPCPVEPEPELSLPEPQPIPVVCPGVPEDPSFSDRHFLGQYRQFVDMNPSWPEDHGAGGIQLQVMTPSVHLPWIELGTPGEVRAFDSWYEQEYLTVTLPVEGEVGVVVGPELRSVVQPVMSNGPADTPLSDATSIEPQASGMTVSSTMRLDTPAAVEPAFSRLPANWMAAMGASFTGVTGPTLADADSQGFRPSSSGRRRGR